MLGVLRLLALFAPAAAFELDKSWRCSRRNDPAACLDVRTCARKSARRAIVTVFDAHVNLTTDARGGSRDFVRHKERLARRARDASIDFLFLLPRHDLQRFPFPKADRKRLQRAGVQMRYADWIVPPALSPGVPVESGGCCGAREFMKFIPFGWDEYDALAVVDNDYDFEDAALLRPLFDCAASGKIITTRGPMTMVNGALLVVPPSGALRDVLLKALETASVDTVTGWNGTPFGPLRHRLDARVQGFFYWFFYQVYDDRRWDPAQVDPCVWNVQHNLEAMCGPELCGGRSRAAGHVDEIPKYRKRYCQDQGRRGVR